MTVAVMTPGLRVCECVYTQLRCECRGTFPHNGGLDLTASQTVSYVSYFVEPTVIRFMILE